MQYHSRSIPVQYSINRLHEVILSVDQTLHSLAGRLVTVPCNQAKAGVPFKEPKDAASQQCEQRLWRRPPEEFLHPEVAPIKGACCTNAGIQKHFPFKGTTTRVGANSTWEVQIRNAQLPW